MDVDHVVASVGGNPLPVVGGVLGLGARTATLILSSETEERDRIAPLLNSRGVNTKVVPIGDAHGWAELHRCFASLADQDPAAHLLYTGGTKAMSASAVDVWEPRRSWNVRAGATVRLRSDAGEARTERVQLSLVEVLQLHEVIVERSNADGAQGSAHQVSAWLKSSAERPNVWAGRLWLADQLEAVGSEMGIQVETCVEPIVMSGDAKMSRNSRMRLDAVLARLGLRILVADCRPNPKWIRAAPRRADQGPRDVVGGVGGARKVLWALLGLAERLGGDEAVALVSGDLRDSDRGDIASPAQDLAYQRARVAPAWGVGGHPRAAMFGRTDLARWEEGDRERLSAFVYPELTLGGESTQR